MFSLNNRVKNEWSTKWSWVYIFNQYIILSTLSFNSLNWQHQLCKNPRPNPDIKTLFVDHSCGQQNGAHVPPPINNPLLGTMPKPGGFPPLGAHGVNHTKAVISSSCFSPQIIQYGKTKLSFLKCSLFNPPQSLHH